MSWQDVNPFLICVISLVGGVVANRHLQRETRGYEREAKRLQYLKSFYEVKELYDKASQPPPLVSNDFDARAKNLIEQSRRWLEKRPPKSERLSAFYSWLVTWFLVIAIFLHHLVRLLNRLLPPPHTSDTAVDASINVGRLIVLAYFVAATALVIRWVVYRIAVKRLVELLVKKNPNSWFASGYDF